MRQGNIPTFWVDWGLRGFYTLIISLLMVMVLQPEVRSQIRSLVNRDFRKVLSTVATDFTGEGFPIKVVKVKTNKALILEFYESTAAGEYQLMQRVDLPNTQDGYIHLRGKATNLALRDVDADKKPEVLVPNFDSNLTAHLTVFSFDPTSRKFIQVQKK